MARLPVHWGPNRKLPQYVLEESDEDNEQYEESVSNQATGLNLYYLLNCCLLCDVALCWLMCWQTDSCGWRLPMDWNCLGVWFCPWILSCEFCCQHRSCDGHLVFKFESELLECTYVIPFLLFSLLHNLVQLKWCILIILLRDLLHGLGLLSRSEHCIWYCVTAEYNMIYFLWSLDRVTRNMHLPSLEKCRSEHIGRCPALSFGKMSFNSISFFSLFNFFYKVAWHPDIVAWHGMVVSQLAFLFYLMCQFFFQQLSILSQASWCARRSVDGYRLSQASWYARRSVDGYCPVILNCYTTSNHVLSCYSVG